MIALMCVVAIILTAALGGIGAALIVAAFSVAIILAVGP
jgi:hypothetical protein